MNSLGYVKTIMFAGLLLCLPQSWAENDIGPVRVNNYVVPSAFASALYQGMTVPVFIRYEGDLATQRSQQKIADAVLTIKDNHFVISQIVLNEAPDSITLTGSVKKQLETTKNRTLGEDNQIHLSNNATLTLDIRSFYFELTVSKNAMAAAKLMRTNMLPDSTSENLSSILNYNLGSYYNKYQSGNSNSSYLTLDNTWSLREHHLNLNGTLYGTGTGRQQGELYRAMYERDYQGHRLAVGMVDTWNLQSIASMSALSSSRIYGLSYGNKSNSQIENTSLALIPITVFLPAAGEVHVYRNGKLLSIQNFSMGSYEIDTSHLPFGIYDVEVQVLVNGRIYSSRIANVNKTFSRKSSVTDNFSWQYFGGSLNYDRKHYSQRRMENYGNKDTWIAGVAAATTRPLLSGVSLSSTLYGFDDNGVNELEANVLFNDALSVNQQGMIATDGSWQSISTINLSLPEGYGSLWGSRQYSHIGSRLPVSNSNFFTVGATANFRRISTALGNLTLSRTYNKYNNNTYTNADYNQSLFANRYATVSMRVGIQNYQYDNQPNIRDKYVNFDVSIPFGTTVSAGISSQNGDLLANATLRKRMDNQYITQVGASVSKRIKNSGEYGNDNSFSSDNSAFNGFATYDTKYNAGTLSASRSSDHSSNISLNSQGSVAWTQKNVYLGKGADNSGVVLNTQFSEQGKMIAQINGQNYPLSGKSNFISLPAYAEYKIELMNDKNSEDSVDIVSGRRSTVVLYPGNVSVLNPEIKQLVTVFGRLRKSNGQYYVNSDIHNHIGKTRSDESGEFAMDVDKRYPIITLIDKTGAICEASLDLTNARGAVWVGDLPCEVQPQMAARTGEYENVY